MVKLIIYRFGGLSRMWIAISVASAFFAGVTSILAKCGIQNTDSTVATAIRTIVVLLLAWIMVFVVGSADQIAAIEPRTWLFLILSGFATGASWLCYFKALQIGDVNKVVPVDKTSTVITLILAFVLLGESFTWLAGVAMVLILAGTMLMIERKESGSAGESRGSSWLWFAIGSALFAALVAILGKIGIEGVESNLGTAIRTIVVLVMSWLMVFVTGKKGEVRHIERRDLVFIVLSGLATGASWLCYFRALQDGLASVVVPIDKLSILVTIAFSYFVFKEKLTPKSGAGLALIVAGTLMLAIPAL